MNKTVCYLVSAQGPEVEECSTMREAYTYAASWVRLGKSLQPFPVTISRVCIIGGFVHEEWCATLTKGNVS